MLKASPSSTSRSDLKSQVNFNPKSLSYFISPFKFYHDLTHKTKSLQFFVLVILASGLICASHYRIHIAKQILIFSLFETGPFRKISNGIQAVGQSNYSLRSAYLFSLRNERFFSCAFEIGIANFNTRRCIGRFFMGNRS